MMAQVSALSYVFGWLVFFLWGGGHSRCKTVPKTISGRGKGGTVKGKCKSRSSRAGLHFPVGKCCGNAERVRAGVGWQCCWR
jgi:hypothetical protein